MNRLEFIKKVEQEEKEYHRNKNTWESGVVKHIDKFFVNTPYPYTNGHLHLGHAFTMAKACFSSRFKRMNGFNVLFPFAFHGTGTPIYACSVRLKEELENEKNKEIISNEVENKEYVDHNKIIDKIEKENKELPKRRIKAKLQQKKGGKQSQKEILLDLGISNDELENFTSPEYYIKYFSPLMESHLKEIGICADFSRKFFTTELNPLYDSFVRWQFDKLKEKDLLGFGKRIIIFSPKDNQPCGDEERKVGEGVQIAQSVCVLFKVSDIVDYHNNTFIDNQTHLLVSTTRIETIYGSTNLFIKENGEYIISYVDIDPGIGDNNGIGSREKENKNTTTEKKRMKVIASEHSLKQLSFQGFTQKPGTFEKILKLKGKAILDTVKKVKLASVQDNEEMSYKELSIIGNNNIDMKKGTGIVMSVPSDSIHDYVQLKFVNNLEIEMPNIVSSDDNDLSEFESSQETIKVNNKNNEGAKHFLMELLIKKHKLKNSNQHKVIEAIHKEHFFLTSNSKILLGPFKGLLLERARTETINRLKANESAFDFYEPESLIISRTGNECVAAFIDSWSINYNDPKWKQSTKEHIEKMEFYNRETEERMKFTAGWLDKWSCSRTYGLGTRLPFDERYLIDSLSDSTIYMALYTVYHKMQEVEREKIEKNRNLFFDFIFLSSPKTPSSHLVSNGIVDKEKLKELKKVFNEREIKVIEEMRNEFNYWYPFDCRVSGKELIMNHLTMTIYNHIAIWSERPNLCPLSYFCNGHLLLNNEKMSKSTGNFLTINKAVSLYGADAARMTLAEGGDFLSDSNFSEKMASQNVSKLFVFYTKFVKNYENLESKMNSIRKNEKDLKFVMDFGNYDIWDKLFLNAILKSKEEAKSYFETMRIREALVSGFYELENSFHFYERVKNNLKQNCNKKFEERIQNHLTYIYYNIIVKLLAPIAPHICDYIYKNVMKKENSLFPKMDFDRETKSVLTIKEKNNLIYINEYISKSINNSNEKKEKLFWNNEIEEFEVLKKRRGRITWPILFMKEEKSLTKLSLYLKDAFNSIRSIVSKIESNLKKGIIKSNSERKDDEKENEKFLKSLSEFSISNLDLENRNNVKKENKIFIVIVEELFEWQIFFLQKVKDNFKRFSKDKENMKREILEGNNSLKFDKRKAIEFSSYILQKCDKEENIEDFVKPFDEKSLWGEIGKDLKVLLEIEIDFSFKILKLKNEKDLNILNNCLTMNRNFKNKKDGKNKKKKEVKGKSSEESIDKEGCEILVEGLDSLRPGKCGVIGIY